MNEFNELKLQLNEQIKREKEEKLKVEGMFKELSEKCDVFLIQLPILECRTEEISKLKEDLENEKKERNQDKKNFLQCIDKLMEEIVELKLKNASLEEKIEKLEKTQKFPFQLIKSEPSLSSSSSELEPYYVKAEETGTGFDNEIVTNLIQNLSNDILAKFQEINQVKQPTQVISSSASNNADLVGITTEITEGSLATDLDSNSVIVTPDRSNNDPSSSLSSPGSSTEVRPVTVTGAHGFLLRLRENGMKAPIYLCKCGKKFSGKSSLDRHLESITGRYIKCPTCLNKYNGLDSLKRHMKSAHNKSLAKGKLGCRTCFQFFDDRTQLREHKLRANHNYPHQ